MSFVEAIVLGIVQGLTEFLPISSTGHLRVVPALLGWDDPGTAFSAVTQLGTALAVVLFFWRDLWRVAGTWLRSLRDAELRSTLDARMGWYLILATVPISVFGLAFKDQIETGARNLWLIGSTLILLGLVLLAAERVGRRTRTLDDVDTRSAVVVGFSQALALIPGVSRSGATISAGLFLGFTREAAARFSFLLSIPAVVLSAVVTLPDIGSGDGPGPAQTAVATLLAFVVGYASIAWLLRWLTSHSTVVFVVYRVALGSLVLVLVATGALEATSG
ncbi:undecaprenyl-diphosphate phosphatase [Iamia majanohamensis]|uniref:Undecaprenyl-diphosphatase n=1 Tax=Iamia majanohamensis TaxID=467976 RepID=A0AAE9YDQ8_9ACTN|nr:undecaprenyl-diphosphate phosphatase [Iamia majanohamensis]WCO65951.1 undecaprenyl-diphosphate phosphatase [Iamia majanohamensis]